MRIGVAAYSVQGDAFVPAAPRLWSEKAPPIPMVFGYDAKREAIRHCAPRARCGLNRAEDPRHISAEFRRLAASCCPGGKMIGNTGQLGKQGSASWTTARTGDGFVLSNPRLSTDIAAASFGGHSFDFEIIALRHSFHPLHFGAECAWLGSASPASLFRLARGQRSRKLDGRLT
jgi:hypothetical protein